MRLCTGVLSNKNTIISMTVGKLIRDLVILAQSWTDFNVYLTQVDKDKIIYTYTIGDSSSSPSCQSACKIPHMLPSSNMK